MLLELALALFVRVTTPDGLVVDLNPSEIVSMRKPRAEDKRVVHGNVHCMIFTSDGKFIGVLEECAAVEQKIKELQ
jgi:hypothetical protein